MNQINMVLSKPSFYTNLKPWHLIVLLAILQILFTFLSSFSFTFDEAIWQYIGRNWFRNGLAPYTGGVDNKSPLIYMIYGFSDHLFGTNFWFPRLLGILSQCVGIYFVFKIAKHIGSRQTGWIAIVFYGLSLLWRSVDGKMVSLTQSYEITSLIISYFLCLKAQKNKYLFISGCMAGIALGFRFSAGFAILPILIVLVKKKSGFILFSIGLLTSCLLFVILLILSGIHLHDFILYSFTDNFVQGSVTDHPLSWKLEQFSNAFFYSELILFYPFLIGYVLIKRKVDLFILWLLSALIGIAIIGMFARSHLKEILPPLCIISSIFVTYLITTYKIPIKPVLLIIAITFFPKSFEPLFGLKKIFFTSVNNQYEHNKKSYPDNEDSKKNLGLWIKSNTTFQDKVLIAGYGAEVQVYSERLSPSIYFNVTQTPVAKKRFFNDLNINTPAMIVVPIFSNYTELVDQDIRTFISTLIAEKYKFIKCLYGYNIYKIKMEPGE